MFGPQVWAKGDLPIDLDPDFAPEFADQEIVSSALVLPDDRILVATTEWGDTLTPDGGLRMLNEFGQVDSSFANPGRVQGGIASVHRLSDGRFLVAGGFTNYAGKPHAGLVRLLPNGSVDPSFELPVNLFEAPFDWVTASPSGMIWFQANGLYQRVNTDLRVDLTVPNCVGSLCGGIIYPFDDGGFLHQTGRFFGSDGQPRTNATPANGGRDRRVLRVEADQTILAETLVNPLGTVLDNRASILRYTPEGAPDPSFSPVAVSGYSRAVLSGPPSGWIYLAELFLPTGGQNNAEAANVRLTRMTLSGKKDTGFELRLMESYPGLGLNTDPSPSRNGGVDSKGRVLIGGGNQIAGLPAMRSPKLFRLRGGEWPGMPAIVKGLVDLALPEGGSGELVCLGNATPPPKFVWRRGEVVVLEGPSNSLSIKDAGAADSGEYSVELVNATASIRSAPAQVSVKLSEGTAGEVDLRFNARLADTNPFYQGIASAISWGDREILVVADSTNSLVDGKPADRVFLLDDTGKLDARFRFNAQIGLPDNFQLLRSNDGGAFAGGAFFDANRRFVPLIKLGANGSEDITFRKTLFAEAQSLYLSEFASWVGLQPDGAVLLKGKIATEATTTSSYARISPAGVMDKNFHTILDKITKGSGFGWSMLPRFGGGATLLSINEGTKMIQFDQEGRIESERALPEGVIGPATLSCVTIDGGIITAARSLTFFGSPIYTNSRIQRILSDGTLDLQFKDSAAELAKRMLLTQLIPIPDGRTLAVGSENPPVSPGEVVHTKLAVLKADGSVDPSFKPDFDADGIVQSIEFDMESDLILAGRFNRVNGVDRPYLVKVILGTANDAPKLTRSSWQAGQLSVRWRSKRGQKYLFESSSSIAGPWSMVKQLTGDGAFQTTSLTTAKSGQEFFRCRPGRE